MSQLEASRRVSTVYGRDACVDGIWRHGAQVVRNSQDSHRVDSVYHPFITLGGVSDMPNATAGPKSTGAL